jgi:hypothetical protein
VHPSPYVGEPHTMGLIAQTKGPCRNRQLVPNRASFRDREERDMVHSHNER